MKETLQMYRVKESGQPMEVIETYDLLSMTADDIGPSLKTPNTSLILHATKLEGHISSSRQQVHRYLHECDKLLRHVKNLGGTSTLIASVDSPVMRAAKLALSLIHI